LEARLDEILTALAALGERLPPTRESPPALPSLRRSRPALARALVRLVRRPWQSAALLLLLLAAVGALGWAAGHYDILPRRADAPPTVATPDPKVKAEAGRRFERLFHRTQASVAALDLAAAYLPSAAALKKGREVPLEMRTNIARTLNEAADSVDDLRNEAKARPAMGLGNWRNGNDPPVNAFVERLHTEAEQIALPEGSARLDPNLLREFGARVNRIAIALRQGGGVQ
jgi:hypothetical protein